MDINKNHFFSSIINKFNVDIIDSGYLIGDNNWKNKNVCSPFSRLYYVESGSGVLRYNGNKVIMKPGNLYLVPVGLTFDFGCDDNLNKLFFHINAYRPDGYDIFTDCRRCIELALPLDDIKKMIELYNSNTLVGALQIKQSMLSHITSMLSPDAVSSFFSTEYSPMVQKTIDYIQLNLSVQITTASLAERLFISESTLCKHFKNEVGVTIGKYIDDQIFFSAEKMLLKSDWSINQISLSLGFCDQFYFSRRFKQKYGSTPHEYRKKFSPMF